MLSIMHYINSTFISLDDIEQCATECGYECQSFFFLRPRLNILFEKEAEEPIDYCRCYEIISDKSQLEPDERECLSKANINPRSIVTIEYRRLSLDHIAKLMRSIINCYGGYILLFRGDL